MQQVFSHIEKHYVEPSSVDPATLLQAALDALKKHDGNLQIERLPDGKLRAGVGSDERLFEGGRTADLRAAGACLASFGGDLPEEAALPLILRGAYRWHGARRAGPHGRGEEAIEVTEESVEALR